MGAFKKMAKKKYDETDEDFIVSVRWLDGYFESFRARQIRISETLIWLRLKNHKNRNIPLKNVRWYSVYPESHEEVSGNSSHD